MAVALPTQKIKQSMVERPTVHTEAGFLPAVTIVCEMGDFTTFLRPNLIYSTHIFEALRSLCFVTLFATQLFSAFFRFFS